MIKDNESGRSMIEMLGVLAIIGVLSVGGIAGYSKAMMKYRTNKTIEQITLLMTNIRSFFTPQGNFKGLYEEGDSELTNKILKKAKLVPEEMWGTCEDGKECIVNAFGGEVNVETGAKTVANPKSGESVIFWVKDLPQEACIEIATMDWRANSGNSIVYLTINGNSEQEALGQFLDSCTTNERVVCAKDMPMSIDNASTSCINNNTIFIKFY